MNKILWAIDAFEKNIALHKKTAQTINTFCKKGTTKIESVFLCLKEELLFAEPFLTSIDFNSLKESAHKALLKITQKIKNPSLMEPKILTSEGFTKRSSLQTLSDYAKSEKASFIAVSTYARTGIPRFFIGSFSETLLIHSQVPLLFVPPKSTPLKKIKTILFPTDLSVSSKQAFKKILALALEHKAEIVLFHQVPNPIEPYLTAGMQLLGGNYIPVSQYLDQERLARADKLKNWQKEAADLKIKSSVVIETKTKPISDSITKCATSKKVSLIAMVSTSGPIAATFVGSIARQVVRQSPCPVWVLHKD